MSDMKAPMRPCRQCNHSPSLQCPYKADMHLSCRKFLAWQTDNNSTRPRRKQRRNLHDSTHYSTLSTSTSTTLIAAGACMGPVSVCLVARTAAITREQQQHKDHGTLPPVQLSTSCPLPPLEKCTLQRAWHASLCCRPNAAKDVVRLGQRLCSAAPSWPARGSADALSGNLRELPSHCLAYPSPLASTPTFLVPGLHPQQRT